MDGQEEKVVLITNLVDRLEYNESKKNWTLKGAITSAEFKALTTAFECYSNIVKRNKKALI